MGTDRSFEISSVRNMREPSSNMANETFSHNNMRSLCAELSDRYKNNKITLMPDNVEADIGKKLPIVCIVNGPGRSGKDTFVEQFTAVSTETNWNLWSVRLSTVDSVYSAAELLTSMFTNDTEPAYCKEIDESISNKSDEYRQFLNDIKMAWSRYCDGPSRYILRRTIDLTENYDNPPSFIFAMCREADEINHLTQVLQNAGYLVIRIYIDGKLTADDYQNDCDHNVHADSVDYDLYITNKGTLNEFIEKSKKIAHQFFDFYFSSDYNYRCKQKHD